MPTPQEMMNDPLLYAEHFPPLGATGRPRVRVNKLAHRWDNANMVLSVVNIRLYEAQGYDSEKTLPGGGEVSESVFNAHIGTPLKASTQHSSWHSNIKSLDKHSIPLSQVAKMDITTGDVFTGKLIAGCTVASQLFLYRSAELRRCGNHHEIVYPRSGFRITYKMELYDAQGTASTQAFLQVPVDSQAYGIFTISKWPARVIVNGRAAEPGDGGGIGTFKISRKAGQNIVWNVEPQ